MEVKTKKKRIRVVAKREKKLLSPKQVLFIDYYTNPKSITFNNAYRSGIKAGFSHEYSNQILYKPMLWLSEINRVIGAERRLKKTEENFELYQNLDIYNGGDKIDAGILGQKIKVDTLIATTHDKQMYSTRTENAVLVKVEHTIDEETKKRLDALL